MSTLRASRAPWSHRRAGLDVELMRAGRKAVARRSALPSHGAGGVRPRFGPRGTRARGAMHPSRAGGSAFYPPHPQRVSAYARPALASACTREPASSVSRASAASFIQAQLAAHDPRPDGWPLLAGASQEGPGSSERFAVWVVARGCSPGSASHNTGPVGHGGFLPGRFVLPTEYCMLPLQARAARHGRAAGTCTC